MFQKETEQKVTGTAGEYIRVVEASCKPVGYTALSAKQNRRKHFAMDNYFGGHAIFLTTTPCDERTIRVQVFANAGKEVSLPNLGDWDDENHLENCRLDFKLRKKTRSLYPGACSLVYQHLMQIRLGPKEAIRATRRVWSTNCVLKNRRRAREEDVA